MATEKEKKFLADLQSDNADVRYAAWAAGGEMDPAVIPELAKLIAGSNPGVAKAATEALNRLVHSVGKQASGARRQAVVRGLIGLVEGPQPAWVRTVALRHLSAIGGDETVAPAAKLLAALGHHGDKEAAELCTETMRSSNIDVAMAGMKALARIGVKPSGEVKAPPTSALSEFQLLEFADSTLRYAGGLARQGDTAEAVKLYRVALARPEEHLQCAAVVGLAKIGTAEAAALIFPALKSPQPKVRRTAQKAWDSLKGA